MEEEIEDKEYILTNITYGTSNRFFYAFLLIF